MQWKKKKVGKNIESQIKKTFSANEINWAALSDFFLHSLSSPQNTIALIFLCIKQHTTTTAATTLPENKLLKQWLRWEEEASSEKKTAVGNVFLFLSLDGF